MDEIESGCGFNLAKFLQEQNEDERISKALDLVEMENITEFRTLVTCVRNNNKQLLGLITQRAYFFSRYLDSKRNLNRRNKK